MSYSSILASAPQRSIRGAWRGFGGRRLGILQKGPQKGHRFLSINILVLAEGYPSLTGLGSPRGPHPPSSPLRPSGLWNDFF